MKIIAKEAVMAKEQEKGRNCKNNGMGEAAAAKTKGTRKREKAAEQGKGKSCWSRSCTHVKIGVSDRSAVKRKQRWSEYARSLYGGSRPNRHDDECRTCNVGNGILRERARASTLGKHQKWKHKHQMIITDKIRHEYIRLNFHNVPAGLDINQGNKRGPIISSTTDKVYRKRN